MYRIEQIIIDIGLLIEFALLNFIAIELVLVSIPQISPLLNPMRSRMLKLQLNGGEYFASRFHSH